MKYLPMLIVACTMACGSSKSTGTVDAGQTLPECTGTWPADWVANEKAVRDQVNALRAQTGTCATKVLSPAPAAVEDPVLTQLSRCFAREQILAGSNALQGSEADSTLADQVQASGYIGQLSGYAGDIVAATPEEVVAGFLTNPAQCEALWNPATTVVGIGYVAYPQGNVPQRWAGVMAITASH